MDADGLYSVPLTGGSWQPYGEGPFSGSTVGSLLLAGTGEFAIGGSGAWQADVE